jgi:glycosyltransferase involved in cell wall biosynthesis
VKILMLAYSLGESSAGTCLSKALAGHAEILFFLGRRSDDSFVAERAVAGSRVLDCLFAGVHYVDHLLNKYLLKVSREVFSFRFEHRLQTWLLNLYVRTYRVDVVHLHWGGYSFFPPSSLETFEGALVLTAHDYQFITGGCHVPMDCVELDSECGKCPMLSGELLMGTVHRSCRISRKLLRDQRVQAVTPSRYVASVYGKALPGVAIHVVPNVIEKRYPHNEADLLRCREWYLRRQRTGRPRLIMVGVVESSRDNKGYLIARELLERLVKKGVAFDLVTVDCSPGLSATGDCIAYGNAVPDELVKLYAEADLCLLPSRYETFSQVTLESIRCLTPVVAFDRTGPADIITDGENGYLVRAFDCDELLHRVETGLHFKEGRLCQLFEAAKAVQRSVSDGNLWNRYEAIYQAAIKQSFRRKLMTHSI